jgi:hypothetical protein
MKMSALRAFIERARHDDAPTRGAFVYPIFKTYHSS